MTFNDRDRAELAKTTKIVTLKDARAAMSALAAITDQDRANDLYDAIHRHTDAINRRLIGSGLTLMYSSNEQCYILY